MLRFDLLQAPAEDGRVLIEPPAAEWPSLMERNLREQSSHDNLQLAGTDLRTVREETRRRLFGEKPSESIVSCGHQPEFVHPGVWAKHVVVHHMARLTGALGADLVVDNDAPRSTSLIVPTVTSEGIVEHHHLPVLTGTAGAAYEGRRSLSPSGIDLLAIPATNTIRVSLKACGFPAGQDDSCIGEYFRGLASVERPRDFVDQHLAGRHRLDRTLAANLRELRVSSAFDGPFVADILLNLGRFAHAYNAALAEYRRDQHVRGEDRPLPDLKRHDERLEAPFWIYQPLQQRRRMWVAGRADAIEVYADNEQVGTMSRGDLLRDAPAALAGLAPWVIRPRALTLTLWARLLVCDFFVHGIGGAKYDRITDGIFRQYYGWQPPPYACATATLRLPLARHAFDTNDAAAARRRIRDLPFNPQRYLNKIPTSLLRERERLILESRRLRESGESTRDRQARHKIFNTIRQVNARMVEMAPGLADRFRAELAAVEREVQSDQIADSREFFYALQPRSRLEMLAGRLVEACRSSSTAAASPLPDQSRPRT